MADVNGWFPKINASGDILSGNSGIWLSPHGAAPVQLATAGTQPVWAGSARVWNSDANQTIVNGAVLSGAYNEYRGSDAGPWAGFSAANGGGIDRYSNTTVTDRHPTACCPRFGGALFAWLQPYESTQRTLYLNGAAIATGAIMNVAISPGGEVLVYQTATGEYTRAIWSQDGKNISQRNDEDPVAAFLAPDGQPWIVTQTPGDGTLVRPAFGYMGYQITGDLYYPDARMFGDRLLVAGSLANGTPRFDAWIDFSAARIDIRRGS